MKRFQVLRYLKRLRVFIAAFVLVGCLLVLLYAESNQAYTAQVIIRYTNPEAANGYAPDGTEINVGEIYGAAVISDVISELGLNEDIDRIRSGFSVTPVASDDKQETKNAALDNGETYNAVPTVYLVEFTADSSADKEYVRAVLDSVINNYYALYSRTHIASAVIPNNSLSASAEKYDYLDCVELLDLAVDEICDYLNVWIAKLPDFRSARTGYSFDDLLGEYEYIAKNGIPELYAAVIGGKMTANRDELICRYKNRRDGDIITLSSLADRIEKEGAVIEQFGAKAASDLSVSGIADGVGGDNAEATYHRLMNAYVELLSRKNKVTADLEYCNEILAVFGDEGVADSVDTAAALELTERLDATVERLTALYAVFETTVNEANEYNAAHSLGILSAVYAKARLNVGLYLGLALVLFTVAGCLGAVVIGRCMDYAEYTACTDKNSEP